MKHVGSSGWLTRLFPFVGWFAEVTGRRLRIDAIAGLTVAMVLIPQSMAYAQLAGLPAYYGLYAGFLPPMVAAMFGSSRQLATGPVAVVSLMTATALEPLATSGSEAYCAYAVLLATLVGVFQFLLGALRLGVVVNFISHPVVNGFTNAAAIIIATSQLSKVFGVSVDKGEHHYETVIAVIVAAVEYTHWPTFGFAASAFAIMYGLRRLNPRIPNVLVAVAVSTFISWATGFEDNRVVSLDRVADPEAIETVRAFNAAVEECELAQQERTRLTPRISKTAERHGAGSIEATKLHHEMSLLNLHIKELKVEIGRHRMTLRAIHLEGASQSGEEQPLYHRLGAVPEGLVGDGNRWRLKVANRAIDEGKLFLVGSGAVVGNIPDEIPGLALPTFDFSVVFHLLGMSVIISLLGFMEAISIAKAMAAKTGQRLDPNQELIGQGLSNIIGALGRSYPVSGSFSRSAVNLQAGAVSGISSVITSLTVLVTLLFLTPLLYHLPKAVLAAIIMMAVVGLINVKGFVHAWKAQRYDGMISVITFVFTLGFAPHLDKGIMIGVLLSIGLYLYRNMRPRIALLSLHSDGTFRNADRFALEQCDHIAAVRFNGSLFFANASYLEDQVMERLRSMPALRHVLIVGNGVNEIDASGEETLALLVDRLQDAGYEISFSGLNDSILDACRRTGLYDKIGEGHLFRNVRQAVAAIHEGSHHDTSEGRCPLVVATEKRAHP